ncbi:MAG: hypothetical protein IPM54_37055 [Polyangiaceae bacterium]|nr:hypothetical protein [Polyangiaceae bacterium]
MTTPERSGNELFGIVPTAERSGNELFGIVPTAERSAFDGIASRVIEQIALPHHLRKR